MVNGQRLGMVVEAAKLYYEADFSQQEIAKRLGISRPSVSRLLQQAKQLGIVKITIKDPSEDMNELSAILEKKFQLKHCAVTPVTYNDEQQLKKALGEAAGEYLHEIVQNEDIIGVTWGTTLFEVAQHVQPKHVQQVQVVQLNGGVSHSETNTYATEILQRLSKAFHTVPYFLPLPAVVDQAVVKEAMLLDRHIKKVLDLGKQANIAMFTVGEVSSEATLIRAGYFTEEELEILEGHHPVGDICSRFFNIRGEICLSALEQRTIGIELSDLGKKDKSILVAGGQGKVQGIYGALSGGYANVLITDSITAKALIDLKAEEEQTDGA